MEQKTPVKILCEMLQTLAQATLSEMHTDDEINAFFGLISNIKEVLAIIKSECPDDDRAKVEYIIKEIYDTPTCEFDKQNKAILQSLNCFAQQ